MQKIGEHNEQEALKLDECFKETLARTRPYVLELTSAESAQLCKVWLDKLNAATSQRRLRNEYLLELCRQLKMGRIDGIFSRPPPSGFLIPLPKSYHMVCISSSVSDLSDYVARPLRSCLKPSAKCIQHQRSRSLMKHRMMDVTSTSQCLDATNASPTVRFRNQNTIRKSQTKIYEQRIDTLSTLITELQTQNEYLKNRLLEHPKHCSNNMDNRLCASINQLTSDVTTLKAKLLEMQKIQNSLKENYKEVVQDYHCTVVQQFTALKHELEGAQLKNEALDNSVSVIAEKLEEIIHGKVRRKSFICKMRNIKIILKDEQLKETEKQWMDKVKAICEQFDVFTKEKCKELYMKQEFLEKKDLELSRQDAGRKEEIELLTNKIHDLEIKLEKKIEDEEKLQRTLVEQYAMMKEELNKWRKEIDYETQTQNQNLTSKVSALKKVVLKLERSKEKLESDYEKRMTHVIKNKDLEIKALQLQLQEQKNELSTSLNTMKQSEVVSIVTLLEKQYKTLLAETEATTKTQTQEHLRVLCHINFTLNVRLQLI
ncbi:hyaluronan mediated motility receptor-like isoform X1 [Hylaeus volcanicus]|uniref:hyaluronan mediated motility receptor-like isoform X1 n=1 Tax=Hylaeus volcanicus TaxID=313075 RepID=UPI0023B85625|nr:hyaluronan mediated motility receptor-like isoform X1 [Hylaeus volcanicus]